ncbi:MAG: hypothetical protein Q8M08_06695 [Bacteroidales bacterium]|nr:hypothetical protein [Bacteroidales bacterium]
MKTLSFNHGSTQFPLIGQHRSVNCRLCHTSLEFVKTGAECIDCHTDMHNQTLGHDCVRCHTPKSWVVNNITEIHQRSRFPLVGAHVTADCFDCHTNASASKLSFYPLGVECFDCHLKDYAGTTRPDHTAGAYSKNCLECHNMTSVSWSGAGINHNFFPLTLGHKINNCQECHKTGNFTGTSTVCVSCHQSNYNSTSNPNHNSIGFSTNCTDCHTTNPGWKPAEYREHDAKSFPIYSGKHNGTWSICSECHTNPASYTQFTCIDCHDHNQPDMDKEHAEVQGYAYNSPACFACHPTGSKEGAFNHISYPLTGAHANIAANCFTCHQGNYINTPNTCEGCHLPAYNSSTNPNHASLSIPATCTSCHTTNPNWKPATFDIHNTFYVLAGAHVAIANNCTDCHQGNYNSTPSTCVGCHQPDYNQTTNPSHVAAQFPTSCIDCHTQSAWIPANWNHDGQYFPIYSGKHKNEWNTCADCHTNGGNYSVFTCITACHPQSQTDNDHQGVSGYFYNSAACYNCHPQGTSAGKMLDKFNKINRKE